MMKTLLSLLLTILVSWASAVCSFAEVLPKDVLEVKKTFDKKGATRCSQGMAETINFLANGRPFNYNAVWGNTDTNNKPIALDFLISGSKDEISSNGSIVLMPAGDKCLGVYVYTYVVPSHDCKTYMQNTGFDDKDRNRTTTYNNGDGGIAYFMALKNVNNLNFIFNDIVGGCSLTIREMLSTDAKK